MARAGAILPDGVAQGLLYDVMQVTTPTGCRTASAPITAAFPIGPASLICGGVAHSAGSAGADRRERGGAPPACIARAVAVVAPVSARASSAYGTRRER